MSLDAPPTLEREGDALVGETPLQCEWALFQAVVGAILILFFAGIVVLATTGTLPALWSRPIVAVVVAAAVVSSLWLVIWQLYRHRLIIVRERSVRVRYRVGPFMLPTMVNYGASRLEEIRVRGTPARDDPWGKEGAFRLEAVRHESWLLNEQTRAFPLAESDRAGWLVAWGEAIAAELGVPCTIARSARSAMQPDEDDATVRPDPDAEYPPVPAHVPVVLEPAPGRITLTITPDRVRKHEAAIESAIGLGIAGVATYLGVVVLPGSVVGSALLACQIGCGVLWLVGAAFFRHGVLNARERWEIDVLASVCEVRRVRGGRERAQSLRPSSIRDVRVGHTRNSNVHPDSEVTEELQIVPREGPWVRLMEGWSDASLRWTARVLCMALAIERPGRKPGPGAGG